MSAMWIGRVERLVPPEVRRASLSIEYMSPTSSRRFSRSRSRKCSSSLGVRPAWSLRGLPLVGTASGIGTGRAGGGSGRRDLSLAFLPEDLTAGLAAITGIPLGLFCEPGLFVLDPVVGAGRETTLSLANFEGAGVA